MKIRIENGRVIDPANGIDGFYDVLINGDKIEKVEKNIADEADKTIDATGKWVTPGLIDIHVHFREPGFEHKETIATGTKSAAKGGFTTVCCMPNTKPAIDSEALVEYIKTKAEKEGVINVLSVGAITIGQNGEELADIEKMAKAGACAISEDGKTVENPALMKAALNEAKKFGLAVLSHCEEEEEIVARDIVLAAQTDAKLHLCHVSTSGSVQLLREAKARGENVTAEVAPHHFTLCGADIKNNDANYKMNPPLRNKSDIEALKLALKDGIIEVIATDHAPHCEDEKNCGFENAANGIVGLETSVPLCITELVRGGWLTPYELIEKMTANPAKVLGIHKGTLSVGADADITIIDPKKCYEIDINKFVSKSKNSPFGGRKVSGEVEYTIYCGKIIVENGKLME